MLYTLNLHNYASLKRKGLRGHNVPWNEEVLNTGWLQAPKFRRIRIQTLSVFPPRPSAACPVNDDVGVSLGMCWVWGGIPRRNIQEAARY